MRIIKLADTDEEMPTRTDVVQYFEKTLKKHSRRGKFGLTEDKSRMQGITRGTLLLFTYKTECMYLARAAGDIVFTPAGRAYLPLKMSTLRPVSGWLAELERALRTRHLIDKNLVHAQKWPIVSDDCDPFSLAFFSYHRNPDLALRLHAELEKLYHSAGESVGYWGNYYIQELRRKGGLATAKRMLGPKKNGKIDAGLAKLIEAGYADKLSVEAISLRPEFRRLFTDEERAEAARRLKMLPPSAKSRTVPPEENFPDTVDEPGSNEEKKYSEGAVKKVLVNAYERNPKARRDCVRHFGYGCQVCGMSFEDVYGEIGKRFIHVHHKKPVALRQKEYQVDAKRDLIPVCPNCHAMLHTRRPPLGINELRDAFEARRKDPGST